MRTNRTLSLSIIAALASATPLAGMAAEDKPEGFIEGSTLNVLARNFTSIAMTAKASQARPETAIQKPGPRA